VSSTLKDDHLFVRPTHLSSRIGSLDFLRGLAILGIVFINIENFAYPNSWSPWKYGFESSIDRDTRFWVYFLTQGKFATMFTLLFGVGFYLFLERLERKKLGLKALDIYARRLLWLFIIGVAHAYFIWEGDVLYHYAICGFLLFPFRSLSTKGLWFSVLVLVMIQGSNAYQKTQKRKESYQNYLEVKDLTDSERSDLENKRVKYWDNFLGSKEPDTTFVKVPKETYLKGLVESYNAAIVHKGMLYYQGFLFPSLMVMIIGIYLYRSGIFIDYRNWKYYWVITFSMLIAGLFINYYRYHHWTYDYFKPVLNVWVDWAFTFNKQLLGIAYILFFNGLYQRFLVNWNVYPISIIGRMALSNYLLQSVLMGFLFYGYGLAWFNLYTRAQLPWMVVTIWVVQLILSWLWSKKFSQGPVERFWKRMTYR